MTKPRALNVFIDGLAETGVDSDFNSRAYSFDNMNQPLKCFISLPIKNKDLVIALKVTRKSFKPVKEHKNMINRFSRSRLGETIKSIVLEIYKIEENEIPPHELKTKSYDVIDGKVFPLK